MQLVRGAAVLMFVLGGCGGGGGTPDRDAAVGPDADAAPDGGIDAMIDAPPDAVPMFAPGAPTNVVAVFGDTEAQVSWDPPAFDGNSPITEYLVTSEQMNDTILVSGSPVLKTGLVNGDSYTFVVVARNAVGDSPPSAPSNAVIPAGVPTTPGTPTAATGSASGEIVLTWAASNPNGRPLTTYTVTSNPDNLTRTTTSTTLTFTGLRNEVNYTFRVTATNELGTSAQSGESNVAQAVLPVCTGTITVTALPPIAVGTGPIGLAASDLNGNVDTFPDLAVTNSVSNTVQVLLGDGAGGFTAGTPIAVGTTPRAVAVGQVNNDGNPDIVVANYGSSTVQVLHGDGSGGFTAQPALTVGTNPTNLVLVDANRDGRLDIVTANFTGSNASLLLANTTGGFNAATTITTFSFPFSIAAADLNQNGFADDLVIGHGTSNAAELISNGNGTYAAPVSVPFNTNQHGIYLGDLDNNGHPDLVLSSTTNATIQVRLRSSTGFAAGTTTTVGAEPKWISGGDFDGDGDIDLVTANRSGGSFSVLRANPAGTFPSATTTSVGAGSFPWSAVAVDLDSDTDADIVVARSGNNDIVRYRVGCMP